MNKKGNNKIVVILLTLAIIALCVGAYFLFFYKKPEEPTKPKEDTAKPQEVIKTHVAYIVINPSLKIEYTEKCVDNVCEEPIVTTYELINEDAKEIFKNVNLLDDDKTLSKVMDRIVDTVKKADIKVDKVEVYSDWDNINNYLEEKKTTNTTYSVKKTETNQIEQVIETKEKEAEQKTVEPEPTKEETKTTEPAKTTTTKDKNTIYLSDNVTYTIGGEGYCCDNCFSDALVKEVSNAKGYYTVKADNSTIDFRQISLKSPYNATNYVVSGIKEKLIAAGGENCSGLGGDTGKLTKELCTQFHLKCE